MHFTFEDIEGQNIESLALNLLIIILIGNNFTYVRDVLRHEYANDFEKSLLFRYLSIHLY